MMHLRLLLLPFSFIYSAIAWLRNKLFDQGIFKSHSFNIPVILVGNLSVGGTGKTPHVEYLVELLRTSFRVATLSRGYGRSTTGFVIAGKGSTSKQVGDEPMQYQAKFENITVAVCENRKEGIEKLLAIPDFPEVIIMDDGYQHRQVQPGFSILLTPIDRLYTRDHVLPAGDLREPRSGYKRAGCIVVTRCDEHLPSEQKQKIMNELNPLPGQQVFFSSLVYGSPSHFFTSGTISLESLNKMNVLLFSGIATPRHLLSFLSNNTAALESARFPDHHEYSKKDITSIKEKFIQFKTGNSIILTTEKDYQRLRNSPLLTELSNLPCYFIPIKVKIDRQETFNTMIENYVRQNKTNS